MNHFEVIIRRKVVFLVIAGLICASAGCRPRSSVEAHADTTKAATEYVAQADQLYTQREDLGNFDGYDFWLNKLKAADGNFITSEMVKAFVNSTEYRGRFGP
jgi:hypothetical protein